jgi:hypothetical protein
VGAGADEHDAAITAQRVIHAVDQQKIAADMAFAIACPFAFLITDYPQPSLYGIKQEHTAVSAGLSDGAQQGPVSKRPQ